MKRIYLLIIIGLFLSAHSVPAQAQAPKFKIDFNGVAPVQVLDIYQHISGFTLIEDSRVRRVHRTIELHATPASKSEGMKLLEDALRKQAGIVITQLDDKDVSVTYNDALPIAGGKH